VTKGEDDVQIGAHGCKVARLTEVKKVSGKCFLCYSGMFVAHWLHYMFFSDGTVTLRRWGRNDLSTENSLV
jgi:hypothetical protein